MEYKPATPAVRVIAEAILVLALVIAFILFLQTKHDATRIARNAAKQSEVSCTVQYQNLSRTIVSLRQSVTTDQKLGRYLPNSPLRAYFVSLISGRQESLGQAIKLRSRLPCQPPKPPLPGVGPTGSTGSDAT